MRQPSDPIVGSGVAELRLRALFLPALIWALAMPAKAQIFADAFSSKRASWETRLGQGDADAVRQELETFLTVQGASASPSNYNDQHAIVGARGLEARACVASGDWEAGLSNLQKAATTASENLSTTEVAFAKLRADHAEKLTLWKGELTDAQVKLDQMNAAPGLNEEQMKLKGQLQTYVAEHQTSVKHSEDALKSMDEALATLRQEKADYENSVSAWTAFLAKEKEDITAASGVSAYVAQRVEQVKADDSKPREERLIHVERLLKLDPSNVAARRLESVLQGKPAPVVPKQKSRKKKA